MTGLLPPLENLLTLETFYIIGNVFSIVSFILSILVLWNIRKLRNAYRLRVRGPSLIKDLSRATSNLAKFLNEYEAFLPQIREELGRVEVKLQSLQAKLSGDPRKSVRRVLRYVDRCEVNVQNEQQVRLVHVEVVKIIEELRDHQKDLDWEM
jgi:hypothetical protein